MMAEIKKGDFVEVQYIGMLKDEEIVFDTTDKSIAKEKGIFNDNMTYGPVVVRIGEAQLLKGLDDKMIGKETGKEYKFELSAEQAFGKKNPKLLKMVPSSVFKKQGIRAMPGLEINIDGMVGMIRTVTGGRVIVDFNHPLSGRDIIYRVKINKKLEDDAEKIRSYLMLQLNVKKENIDVAAEGEKAKITFKNKVKLPQEAKDQLISKIKEFATRLKDIEFIDGKQEKIKEDKKE